MKDPYGAALSTFVRRRYSRRYAGRKPHAALNLARGRSERGKGTPHGLTHPNRCRAVARSTGLQCKNFAHTLNLQLGKDDGQRFKCLFHSAMKSPAKRCLEELRRRGIVRGWRQNLRDRQPPPVGSIPTEFRQVWAAGIAAAAHGDDRAADWLWHKLSQLCARLQGGEITAGELYRAMTTEAQRVHERQASKTCWKSPEGRAEARKRALNPAYLKRLAATAKASAKPKTTPAED